MIISFEAKTTGRRRSDFLTFCRSARICSKADENVDASRSVDNTAPDTGAAFRNIVDSKLCRNLRHLKVTIFKNNSSFNLPFERPK